MASQDWYYFRIAADFASRREDLRGALVGAAGVRESDGVVVVTRNSPAENKNPEIHAEARLCGKVNPGSEIYVARVLKNGEYAMAKPCPRCQSYLKSKRVSRVSYTISDGEYGVLDKL